ncbi:MAG: AAC(3) family N-acetyltransferase [Bacteroidota bacterium]|nr:AAC(3) family N-acetyltransferase [Bacteroidota bacterium]
MKNFIPRIIGRLKREKQKLVKKLRFLKPTIKKDKLKKDLLNVGIQPGDTILVHSSLSKTGNVEGGASTVIAALIETVTEKGNVAMPSYSYVHSMIQTTKEADYVFIPDTTPSVVGFITETFRKWKNIKRSIHPTHSVCVHGAGAEFITSGHLEAETNFGLNTPFHRMRELKGKMVGIGVTTSIIPLYHSIEDFYPEEFPGVYIPQSFPVKVMVNNEVVEKKIFVHDPAFHADRIDKNSKIESWFRNHFRQQGLLYEGTFGDGEIWWMDMQSLFAELLTLKKKGISIYNIPTS